MMTLFAAKCVPTALTAVAALSVVVDGTGDATETAGDRWSDHAESHKPFLFQDVAAKDIPCHLMVLQNPIAQGQLLKLRLYRETSSDSGL